MNAITINIFDNAQEAIKAGFTYHTENFTVCDIVNAVVVKNGTLQGNSTVDVIMKDVNGNKFVAIITGNLLKGIANCCN